ncbi:MAG: S41 family peptidase [Gammaproteobacteria bacterium]|jgi:carboxyl-terminal processing protease
MKTFLKSLLNLTIIIILLCSNLASATQPPRKNSVTVKAEEVRRLGTVINYIKKLYVNPTTDQQLFSGAIAGMLKNLDPHSAYLDTPHLQRLFDHARGDFAGIGVEITQDKGLIKVISPIDDTPAQKAGIKAGDYIIAVNDKSLVNKPINEAIKLMRGKKGTKVTLTVVNKQDKKPRKLTITRAIIKIESVKGKILEPGYAYIRISQFQAATSKKLIAKIKELQKQSNYKLYGLILDLRNNPGGLLDSAAKVADVFLDSHTLGTNKRIVYTKGRTVESHKQILATKGDYLKDARLIVLINRGSASGSEIVAGALQDHKRAIIMGERSFGKGSVQTIFPIDKKTGIKLTTSLYYTPKGREIQAKGIEPDIAVQDLKFQPSKEEAIIFWKIRETDLPKYIKNGSHKKQQHNLHKQLQQLRTNDYQLYEALRLLQSLHLLHQPKDV